MISAHPGAADEFYKGGLRAVAFSEAFLEQSS
jgi:hypothetical protein